MSDPAPLPFQNLLGHWFWSCSLPQIFVWDHLRPSNVIDAPQTCVNKCLNLPQHCLCLPPSFTFIQQNRLHVGAEDAKFGSRADLFGGPDVLEHDKGCSCFADPGCDISVRAPLLVNGTSKVEEEIRRPDGLSPTVTGVLAVELIFISSVFFLLILRPVPADMVSRRVFLSCIWLWLCDRSARSSAKSRSSSCDHNVHCIPLLLPVVVVFMIQSMTRRKRNGDSRHP